jgi:hypothetical protein
MFHVDGGEGMDEEGPMESPWVPEEVGLLFAERVELVPDMAAAGGGCCGQGVAAAGERRGGPAAWRRAAEGLAEG